MASTTFTGSKGGTRIVGGAGTAKEGPGPEIMAAATLEGDEVVTPEGEALGRIKEIMLDVVEGRVAYAVLSSGGFLGLGDKLFAVPWSALTLDATNKRFILDVDKEKLKNAPGFDKDHWPSMADATLIGDITPYYGQRSEGEPPEI